MGEHIPTCMHGTRLTLECPACAAYTKQIDMSNFEIGLHPPAYTRFWGEPTSVTQVSEVDHPSHYTQGGIECIDAIEAALSPEEFKGFCKGNAMKYEWREKHKGGKQSIEKAIWYLQRWLLTKATN